MQQTSLLAHLYPYFKGSQEDVATSSLSYIVSRNECINKAFTNHISKILQIPINETYQYKCQAVGKNNERPDMAGYDTNGDEKLLCESKFYAALTINQPNTYLKRLIEEKGIGLIFICPDVRKKGLWNELTKLVDKDIDLESNEINDFCIEINNSIRLGITSWKAVLSELEQTAMATAMNCVPDIKQLQGYCDQLDHEAFIPFDVEDFGIDLAMKAERPYRLLNALVEAIKAEPNHEVNSKGLRKAKFHSGDRRYLRIDGFCVNLEFDTNKWKNPDTKNTPFWISINKDINGGWQQDEQCKKAMLRVAPDLTFETYIALIPKCYVALSEVADDMKKQVFEYIQLFKET